MDKLCYPSVQKMTNLESQLALVPESMKLFLQPLIKTEKRIAAWGQSIIKTCRPRSGVLPFTMRFALQIDHRFGSKWLIEELHSFGLCESYHVVGNYKYCYLRNKLKLDMTSATTKEQVNADDEEEEEETTIDAEH